MFKNKWKPVDLNYSISDLNNCPNDIKIWSEVYIIWYPKFWITYSELNTSWWKVTGEDSQQMITNWIISWKYNQSNPNNIYKNIYPYSNYYISNKMDSWNSGWPAFSIYNNKYCLLGIATWVNKWNYDNQWIIQNINNITYTWKDY